MEMTGSTGKENQVQNIYTTTIFFNETRGDRFFGWTTTSTMKKAAVNVAVGADTHEGAAEMAFRLAGNDPEFFDAENPRTERSMSVGDLVLVWGGQDDIRVFACESAGWLDVTKDVDIRLINEATLEPEEYATWKANADAALARFRARVNEHRAALGQDPRVWGRV